MNDKIEAIKTRLMQATTGPYYREGNLIRSMGGRIVGSAERNEDAEFFASVYEDMQVLLDAIRSK